MTDAILRAEGIFTWYRFDGTPVNERFVTGILEIGQDGISNLSLGGQISSLEQITSRVTEGPVDEKGCIMGILPNRQVVYLRRLIFDSISLGGAVNFEKCQALETVVFSSPPAKPPNLTKIKSLRVRLDSLGKWAVEPVVKHTRTKRSSKLVATKPAMQTYKLPDRTVHVRTDIKSPSFDGSLLSATIEQATWMEMTLKVPCPLESIQEEFRLLQDLLLLLAGTNVALPWPIVQEGKNVGTYYFERQPLQLSEVSIYDSWAILSHLGSLLGTLLSNMKKKRDVLGPGLDLYIAGRRNPDLHLELLYSTAIFGLEALHRKINPDSSDSKFQEKIDRIIADVKLPKDKKWLEGRTKHLAEPSLQDRLYSLFLELDIGLEEIALKDFCKKCADWRNQFGHHGGQREGDYDSYLLTMHELINAVQPLYHAVLCNQIELPRELILQYFHSAPHSTRRRRILEAAGLRFVAPKTDEKSQTQASG